MQKNELELLAPAGSLKTLKAVVYAGADAVYFGGDRFGARAYANNFTREEVEEAIAFGHLHNRKIILAVNTLLKEQELEEELYDYLLPYYERGLDAVIVQDLGVMQFIKEYFPALPIHTSTQMTVCNVEGAKLLADSGASRVVMARELSLKEIRTIHEAIPVEIESFVHGALCYCYSGQCLLSSIIGGRSGNRGRCAQPCRLPYEISEAGNIISQKNQEFPLSPKDLCTIDLIPELAEHGVYSFKIEGRMKQTEYAAGVVSIYRSYIDRYLEYGRENYRVLKEDQKKLLDFGNRSGFTDGYYKRFHGSDMITFEKPNHAKAGDKVGIQTKEDFAKQETKEKIKGKLRIQKDTPIVFEVQWKEIRAEVKGQAPLPAQKQPLTEDKVRERMCKTGNTCFEFEMLTIVLEDGLFLPVQAMNELRRIALEELVRQKTEHFQRVDAVPQVFYLPGTEAIADARTYYAASVETKEQLTEVLKHKIISKVYVDSIFFSQEDTLESRRECVAAIKKEGKEAWLTLPAIFRAPVRKKYDAWFSSCEVDGYLVKNLDEIGYLKEKGIAMEKIRIDHSLYTYSNRSQRAYEEFGISKNTVPLELNRKEMHRRDNRNSELLIYGYLPLMTTAQCLKDNLTGCDRKLHQLAMKDRYGISFPIKNNCGVCYNTIYNSKAMSLLGVMEEVQQLQTEGFRLSFTIENQKETREIIDLCEMAENHKINPSAYSVLKDITYGHYKRGVE